MKNNLSKNTIPDPQLSKLSDLKSGSHIHLMGVCGTAMASLAGLLKDKGFHVTGSDQNPYPPMSTQLEKLNVIVMNGYRKENLHPKPDFVIVGNVISANNPEAVELKELGIPFTSLPQALGEFTIGNLESIVIAGTHGKTTTTSAMAWMAEYLGLQPGFLIGGIPKNFSYSFKNPQGKYFIIEGDEYDTAYFDKVPKFVHYKPRHVILTSIEFDHADIYRDLDHVKSAFKTLLELIPIDGHLFYCAHDHNIRDILGSTRCKNVFSYGEATADYAYHLKKQDEKLMSVEITFQGKSLGLFETAMSGKYNLLNMTATVAMAHQLGWNLEKAKEAHQNFLGVKRRQEILGEPNGVLVIEDFAHHPTAVRETITGIKAKYPQRRLFSIFEPRSATSRRKIFQKDYVNAFRNSDQVIVAQAFDQAKINEGDRFSAEELIRDIEGERKNQTAHCFAQVSEIVGYLKQNTKKNDVVLIMSNGGFDGIYSKLMKALGE